MTVAQYIAKVNATIKTIEEGRPMRTAIRDTIAVQHKRIFEDGKNSKGGDIGKYKGGPLYVNPETSSPRGFPPAGKPGASRNIKNRKTRYFESYSAFKARIGTQSSAKPPKVSLILFGDLSSDFAAGVTTKVSTAKYRSGLARAANAPKLDNAVDKYGDTVFRLSKEEKARYRRVLGRELSKAF